MLSFPYLDYYNGAKRLRICGIMITSVFLIWVTYILGWSACPGGVGGKGLLGHKRLCGGAGNVLCLDWVMATQLHTLIKAGADT